ncbi:MAG: cupin domain-containing protein [Thermoflexales bacterium]|nr:cupin domain-containing protein [Thermoflexales bacterium]
MLGENAPTTNTLPKRQQRRRRGAPAVPSPIAGSAPAQEVNVGRCLRELREERKLSIRALAEKSGLNVNTLSLIENGKSSPSVSTLQQIALALESPITAFFDTSLPRSTLAHIKANDRPRAAFAHGVLEDLGAGLSGRTVEPFVVTLEPNAGSGAYPVVHTGYEFVFCLEGRIVYTIEDHTCLLEPGDSLLFESRLPHRWQNVDETPSRALLVMCPSDERDRPTERHFQT